MPFGLGGAIGGAAKGLAGKGGKKKPDPNARSKGPGIGPSPNAMSGMMGGPPPSFNMPPSGPSQQFPQQPQPAQGPMNGPDMAAAIGRLNQPAIPPNAMNAPQAGPWGQQMNPDLPPINQTAGIGPSPQMMGNTPLNRGQGPMVNPMMNPMIAPGMMRRPNQF